MRFTFLTQYYPPETGAPQNRIHSLARHLRGMGHEVRVITAMPNYPAMRVFDGYRGKWFMRESLDGVSIWRSWIYATQRKGILPRLANYFSFVISSFIAGLRVPKSDYIICESPPLFLGMSAWALSRLKHGRLIFNVSDLWPESAEKLGIVTNRTLLNLAYRQERWLYRSSHLVTGQTQGIVRDIATRFPHKTVHWLPNGVDAEMYESPQPDPDFRARHGLADRKLFVYAGIIGHAQGLDVIVRAAARLQDRRDIAFVVIGDGPLTAELRELDRKLQAGVVFVPGMPKPKLIGILADAYASVVPLRKLELFLGAIPSKLFDALALGVPLLLAVDGEARELFIEQAGAGLFCPPEDEDALVAAVVRLADDPALRDAMGERGRRYVHDHFDRGTIAREFLARVVA